MDRSELKATTPHEANLRLLRTERKSENKRLEKLTAKLQAVAGGKKPQAVAS